MFLSMDSRELLYLWQLFPDISELFKPDFGQRAFENEYVRTNIEVRLTSVALKMALNGQ